MSTNCIQHSPPAWSCLPGIADFCKRVEGLAAEAGKPTALARMKAWELTEACLRYAFSPEVKNAVSALNRLPDGNRPRGRPYTALRLVKKALSANIGVSLSTLETWQRSYEEARNTWRKGEFDEARAKSPTAQRAWVDELSQRIADRRKAEDAQYQEDA